MITVQQIHHSVSVCMSDVPICVKCLAHHNLHYLIILTMLGDMQNLWSFLFCRNLLPALVSSILDPNIFLSTYVSKTLQIIKQHSCKNLVQTLAKWDSNSKYLHKFLCSSKIQTHNKRRNIACQCATCVLLGYSSSFIVYSRSITGIPNLKKKKTQIQ